MAPDTAHRDLVRLEPGRDLVKDLDHVRGKDAQTQQEYRFPCRSIQVRVNNEGLRPDRDMRQHRAPSIERLFLMIDAIPREGLDPLHDPDDQYIDGVEPVVLLVPGAQVDKGRERGDECERRHLERPAHSFVIKKIIIYGCYGISGKQKLNSLNVYRNVAFKVNLP